MDQTSALRKRLGDLSGLEAQTEAVERKILEASRDRLDVVQADLDRLRPRVALDDGAAGAYEKLIIERGRLNTVVANALAVLGSSA